jgi:hypothetical protein
MCKSGTSSKCLMNYFMFAKGQEDYKSCYEFFLKTFTPHNFLSLDVKCEVINGPMVWCLTYIYVS